MRNISPAGEWRDDEGRNAEAPQTVVSKRRIGGRDRRAGRRYVVEKPAPLIVIDHHDCARPIWAGGHSFINRVQEGLPISDIGMRMIIIREPLLFPDEAWVHERNARQCPRRTIGKETADGARDGHVLGTP